jgi:hypothetical protein
VHIGSDVDRAQKGSAEPSRDRRIENCMKMRMQVSGLAH